VESMNEIALALKEWWQAITAASAVALWGARIERRTRETEREVEHLGVQISEVEERSERRHNEDRQTRERELGRIDGRLDEISGDVKELLQRTARAGGK